MAFWKQTNMQHFWELPCSTANLITVVERVGQVPDHEIDLRKWAEAAWTPPICCVCSATLPQGHRRHMHPPKTTPREPERSDMRTLCPWCLSVPAWTRNPLKIDLLPAARRGLLFAWSRSNRSYIKNIKVWLFIILAAGSHGLCRPSHCDDVSMVCDVDITLWCLKKPKMHIVQIINWVLRNVLFMFLH